MSNAYKGEVSIEGTSYVMRYTFNSLCEIEDKMDMNLLEYFEKVLPNPKMADIRFLLWVGLVPTNPDMSLSDAGDIMQEVGYQKILKSVSKAFQTSLGIVGSPNGASKSSGEKGAVGTG